MTVAEKEPAWNHSSPAVIPFDVFSGLLAAPGMRLLIVGGVAVNAHGFAGMTVDIDGIVTALSGKNLP